MPTRNLITIVDLPNNSTFASNLCVDSVLESSRTILYAAVLRILSPINFFPKATYWVSLLTLILCATISFAANLDPTHQTQINKIDPLFEENIKDYKGLESAVDGQVTKSVQGIEKQQGFNDLPNSELATDEASRLSAIGANDLDSQGRAAQNKEAWIDDVFIDYTKPGAKKTKEDMKEIASSTDKLMLNLLGKLKELGIVDCDTVKGDIEVEPQYYIDLETKPVQDRIYDQFFCEELRNRYSCADSVTVKCIKTGKAYTEWQHKTIRFNGHMLHNQKVNWGYAVHWKTKRWGWHITPYHPPKGNQVDSIWWNNPAAIIADARVFIANHLNVAIEQIREDVGFPPGGRGVDDGSDINPVGCRWRVAWNEYEFTYYYRDVYTICEDWSEDWNEVCHLQ